MSNYEVVAIRFNMSKDEAILYNNLNPDNRAGHIKQILKEIFIGEGVQIARRSYIEDIVQSIIGDRITQNDIKEDLKFIENESMDENDLLLAVSNIMKG